jgi:hypothetical protein
MGDSFTVYTSPLQIHADPHNQKKITNMGGGSVYYKTTNAVSTSDSTIAAAANLAVRQDTWLIAANNVPVNILVEDFPPKYAYNQPKAISLAGPINSATTALVGTDAACTSDTMHGAVLFVGRDFYVTGVGYRIGSVGGTTKVIASVHDESGVVMGNSSATTNGTVVGTTLTTQKLAMVTPFTIPGGTNVFVGLTFNGTTAKFLTVPVGCDQGVIGGDATQTSGTVAAVTVPTTFTADVVPYVFLY